MTTHRAAAVEPPHHHHVPANPRYVASPATARAMLGAALAAAPAGRSDIDLSRWLIDRAQAAGARRAERPGLARLERLSPRPADAARSYD